jgi:hypothetical protein
MTFHPTVEDVMLDLAHFQSAGLIDDQVPDRFGLYAIRTRDLAKGEVCGLTSIRYATLETSPSKGSSTL